MNDQAVVAQTQETDLSGFLFDKLINKAQERPRDLAVFVDNLRNAALSSPDVAGSCVYGLPRAGKVIEGASVRFAEMIASTYKHLMVDVQPLPVAPGDKEVTSLARVIDLENISLTQWMTKRRIVSKDGRRYADDMVTMTQNANSAVCYRETVFKAVPRALWWPIYLEARVLALGEGGTIVQKRQDMIAWFGKLGVQEAQILKRLDVQSANDINVDELVKLKGLANAIRDGEITAEEAFSMTGTAPQGTPDLASKLSEQREQGKGNGGSTASDADIARRAAERKKEQEAGAPAADAPVTPEHPEPAPEPPLTEEEADAVIDTITRQKATALKQAADKAGVSEAALMDHLAIVLEVDSLTALTAAQADAVADWLETQKAQGELL